MARSGSSPVPWLSSLPSFLPPWQYEIESSKGHRTASVGSSIIDDSASALSVLARARTILHPHSPAASCSVAIMPAATSLPFASLRLGLLELLRQSDRADPEYAFPLVVAAALPSAPFHLIGETRRRRSIPEEACTGAEFGRQAAEGTGLVRCCSLPCFRRTADHARTQDICSSARARALVRTAGSGERSPGTKEHITPGPRSIPYAVCWSEGSNVGGARERQKE